MINIATLGQVQQKRETVFRVALHTNNDRSTHGTVSDGKSLTLCTADDTNPTTWGHFLNVRSRAVALAPT